MPCNELNKVEVALKAGVSTDTVSRAIRNGELPATREPHKVVIAPADASAWIASRRQPIEPRREQGA